MLARQGSGFETLTKLDPMKQPVCNQEKALEEMLLTKMEVLKMSDL